jgi:hypothetical protein
MVSARWRVSALQERYLAAVKRHINNKVGWTSRATAWPPLSLDLIMMDVFLLGYLKERVYAVPPR